MPPAEQLYAETLALKTEVAEVREENAQLRVQIAWLKNRLFGPGQGEKQDRAQLLLHLAELEKLLAPKPEPRPVIAHERARPLTLAPAPPRPAPGGDASAGLIAWILLAKYVDHQPLYRQEKQSARWGATISRQTMCEWVALGAIWLESIYRQMQQELLAGHYLQVDETPVRCQDPDVPGKTVQGWLWVISRPGGDVVFEWRMSRRHDEVSTLLAGFQGLLQSDGYEAYARFVAQREGLVHLGCWAHARRHFHEALADAPVRAGFILRLIGHLCGMEKQWDEDGIVEPAQRAHLRRRDFAMTLSLLKRTATHLVSRVLPRSLL